ncbi:MAG: hypothetical protein U5J83_08190 [Bryobacterales bacterium]|nr:hypothetical protein [Bryobacterales bacterium]
MEANDILEQLRRKLEIPSAEDAGNSAPIHFASGEAWHKLRKAIRDLEESAAQVGEMPRNYPMHLNLVIRAMHAMMPWYTRPLRHHAEQSVAVARAMEAVLMSIEEQVRKGSGTAADPPR